MVTRQAEPDRNGSGLCTPKVLTESLAAVFRTEIETSTSELNPHYSSFAIRF